MMSYRWVMIMFLSCLLLVFQFGSVSSFTLATASASELRAMVKQLMNSKRELEEKKELLMKEAIIMRRDIEDKEASIAHLKQTKGKSGGSGTSGPGGNQADAGGSAAKIDELESQLQKMRESKQGFSSDDKEDVDYSPWSCPREAADLIGSLYIDTLNISQLPTVTKSITIDDGECEVEVGDILTTVNDVPISEFPLQVAIEEALSKKGPDRFVLPLIKYEMDGGVEPSRGRGLDATRATGFALTGVLDVRVVNILSSPNMELRFEAMGEHRERLQDTVNAKKKEREAIMAKEQAELEARRNKLTAAQRAEEDAREARKRKLLEEEAKLEEERRAEKAALEQRRKEAEEREAKRAWHRSMWKSWREEGREFEYDVDVSEEMAKKYDFQMGMGFTQGAQAIVNFIKPKSIASTLKIEEGDILLFVNDVNTTQMATEMAVRTLTLAKWPRNLGFRVPFKKIIQDEVEEEEDDEEAEEMDEEEIAKRLEAYMLDPVGAEIAEQEAQDKKETAPRKKGKKKKRPQELTLRVTEPEVVAGDYTLNVASWGPIFEGPDWYETDDDAEKKAEMFWPCIPLSITATNPPTACGDGVESIVPHEGADHEEVDHEGEWGKDIVDRPEIALVVRGSCIFTDKIRALQPMMLPEGSYAGGGNGQGALVSVAIVVNTDDKPLDVPKGQARIDDLSITVASVNASAGSVLLDAVNYGALGSSDPALSAPAVRVKGWVGYEDDCISLTRKPRLPENVPMRRSGDDGGKFVAMTSHGDYLGPYDFASALFGPSTKAKVSVDVSSKGVKMVIADPIDACDMKQYKVRVRGSFVITVRGGGCGFADKVLALQEAGAVGVLVMNTIEGKPTAMMADDSQSAMVKIPAFMVTSGLEEDLKTIEKLKEMNGNTGQGQLKMSLIGRFIFEDHYGNYDSE